MRRNLLYVDDEAHNLSAFQRVFYDSSFIGEVFVAQSAEEGLQLLDEHDIAVIVSDQRMPGVTGTEFLARVLERRPETVRLILTAYTDVREILDAINRGHVYYFVTKPWQDEELRAIVRRAVEHYETAAELARKNRELELAYRNLELAHTEQVRLYEMLITDERTGARNYHYFRARLGEELARHAGSPLSLALVDVGGLGKRGAATDSALREVARTLQEGVGRAGVVARYGGDEFALVLPGLLPGDARTRVAEIVSRMATGPSAVSLSGGVAGVLADEQSTPDDLVQRADEALARAKAQGGRVVELDR